MELTEGLFPHFKKARLTCFNFVIGHLPYGYVFDVVNSRQRRLIQEVHQHLMDIIPSGEWEVQVVEEYDGMYCDLGVLEISYKDKTHFHVYFTKSCLTTEIKNIALTHLQIKNQIKIICKLKLIGGR